MYYSILKKYWASRWHSNKTCWAGLSACPLFRRKKPSIPHFQAIEYKKWGEACIFQGIIIFPIPVRGGEKIAIKPPILEHTGNFMHAWQPAFKGLWAAAWKGFDSSNPSTIESIVADPKVFAAIVKGCGSRIFAPFTYL